MSYIMSHTTIPTSCSMIPHTAMLCTPISSYRHVVYSHILILPCCVLPYPHTAMLCTPISSYRHVVYSHILILPCCVLPYPHTAMLCTPISSYRHVVYSHILIPPCCVLPYPHTAMLCTPISTYCHVVYSNILIPPCCVLPYPHTAMLCAPYPHTATMHHVYCHSRSLMCGGRMWEGWQRPSRRCWMPYSCLSCTLTSLQGVYGGRGFCCMGPPARGKPCSLRPWPLSVGSTSSGTFMGPGHSTLCDKCSATLQCVTMCAVCDDMCSV